MNCHAACKIMHSEIYNKVFQKCNLIQDCHGKEMKLEY